MFHECDKETIYENERNSWFCEEWETGELYLIVNSSPSHFHGIIVKVCPFCGYQPERSKREDLEKCTDINHGQNDRMEFFVACQPCE